MEKLTYAEGFAIRWLWVTFPRAQKGFLEPTWILLWCKRVRSLGVKPPLQIAGRAIISGENGNWWCLGSQLYTWLLGVTQWWRAGLISGLLRSHVPSLEETVDKSASMCLLLVAWASSLCGTLITAGLQKRASQQMRQKLCYLLRSSLQSH